MQKTAIKNTDIRALYQAAAKDGQTAFNVATSDALNPPVIKEILSDNYPGIPGDTIIIQATDDFKVETVIVSIHQATAELLEQGKASLQPDAINWSYTATRENPIPAGSRISVTAMDLARNSTSLSIIM